MLMSKISSMQSCPGSLNGSYENIQCRFPVRIPAEVFDRSASCPKLCAIYQSYRLKGSGEAISANKCDAVLMGCGSSLMRMSVSGVSN